MLESIVSSGELGANLGESMISLWNSTGFAQSSWQDYVMLLISFVLFYLAIGRGFEPLLLVPIAFGMMLANIPGAHEILYAEPVVKCVETAEGSGLFHTEVVSTGGLFYYLSKALNGLYSRR